MKSTQLQLPLLVLLVLFSPLAIDIYLPALPMIAEVFHVKHALAQDTISWFLFSMGIGQVIAGPLADKYGRKRVAVVGIAIYGASAIGAWYSSTIGDLLMARFTQGLGACATSVTAFATVRDMYGPEKSGRMISYLNGAICFIPALAPILGSYLTQHYGWRSNFSFMAFFSIVIAILILMFMKETNPKAEKGNVFRAERYVAVLSNQSFMFHSVLAMLAMAVILAYVTTAPILLIESMGLSMDQFTFWFGLNALANIFAAFIAPKFSDALGYHRGLTSGLFVMVAAGIVMLILPSDEHPWAFMIPIFMSSIGFALVLSISAGKALAPFGEKAGTAAALLGLFQMSGAGLMVGTIQRLNIEPQLTIALHLFLVLPALLFHTSGRGRAWHKKFA